MIRLADDTTGSQDAVDVVRGRVGTVLRGDHDGRGLRVGVACSLFNGDITRRLLEGTVAGLRSCQVDPDDVTVAWVPGAFELPMVARSCCLSQAVDAVICLGAVVRGETGHYDLVAGECAHGLQRVQLDTGVPVVFGVLTTDTEEQARARSVPAGDDGDWRPNKGWEAAVAAVEMVNLLRAPALRAH